MNSPEFNQFFRVLVSRFRKETHLSDITFTALEVVPGFKEDFVHFFFADLSTAEEIEVTREFWLPSGDGQPDFVFQCESWDLIVENKLWDRNYHFTQYGVTPLSPGKPTYMGLIANHTVGDHADWQVRHWMRFVDHFNDKLYGDFTPIFAAYLHYVKTICAMSEFKNFQFDFKSLFSFTHFVRMLERALRTTSSPKYKIEVKPDKKWDFGDCWSGFWFELDANDSPKPLKLWIGISFEYESEPPAVEVDVHQNENPVSFSKIERKLKDTSAFKKLFTKEDASIRLRMPHADFNKLNIEPSKEDQLSKLRSFVTACCDALVVSMN